MKKISIALAVISFGMGIYASFQGDHIWATLLFVGSGIQFL